ncbi:MULTISPECIES: putative iron-sulfur cluster-binding metallochaperone [Halobacteriales]|uniref:CopZ zinc binding domain-containing protein n=1 Tax=Halorussus aquaticus TaxID=2953748 RepID=A0ABD5Q7X6_9EURY|nr:MULTISPECIES: hypothetical protein [Halobacteriales]USZ78528.1 hypothetical protein NGM07_23875 [Halorussus vallis]
MPATTEPCPDCGNAAGQIKTETVRNMVEPFGNQDIEDDVQYRICKTQDCPVVYFADELDQQFEIDVIREQPNFKLDGDAEPYPLCYCFGYNKEHIQEDIAENGETNIDDWITERVQAEECACRWKSPLGGCCLGNVRAAITEAQEELV